jgi:glucose dehydrogenase
MFEVGKKYKYSRNLDVVFTCIAHYGVWGWMKRDDQAIPVTVQYDTLWSEYVEPRKEYFNAYKTKISSNTFYDGPHKSRESADGQENVRQKVCSSYPQRYGVLTVTHHSDTKVETHFEVVPRGKA